MKKHYFTVGETSEDLTVEREESIPKKESAWTKTKKFCSYMLHDFAEDHILISCGIFIVTACFFMMPVIGLSAKLCKKLNLFEEDK